MIWKFFVVWLLLLPFVAWPWMFEGSKILWFLIGGFFLTVFWLVKLRTKFPKIINKADFYYLFWLLVLLISSLFGIHPLDSILGGSYRHQGVLFFLTLWLIGKTVSILPSKNKEFLAKGIAFGVAIESLIVILQKSFDTFFIFPMTSNSRPLGTLGEPNAAAGFLAIGLMFLFQKPILFIPVFLAILITQSRTGIVASLVVVLGFFVINARKIINWPRQRRILAGLFLLIIFVIAGFVAKDAFLKRPPSVFENRQRFWQLGWKKIIEKPFLGYGAESGEVVYDIAFAEAGLPLSGLIVDRSHNLLIDVATWSGLGGLILFLCWLVAVFNSLTKKGKWINVIGGLSWLVFSMFQPLSVVHWVLFILILNY